MKRAIHHRAIDRIWCEVGRKRENAAPLPAAASSSSGSVSGTMLWPLACKALADGTWSSRDFRRRRAVRQVVETLAPMDGRHFARWIKSVRPSLLAHSTARAANAWGDPIQAPGWILGTAESWSPTSLRYLAHALWLEESGFTKPKGAAVEVGVGFGGLAAMMAAVSEVGTHLVDLPDVERAAKLQMKELGLEDFVASKVSPGEGFCFVSNYAFTELNRDLQDEYVERYARHAESGVIASNARIFSEGIGGRSNEKLVRRLHDAGLDARIVADSPMLGPSDRMCGNVLIWWKR